MGSVSSGLFVRSSLPDMTSYLAESFPIPDPAYKKHEKLHPDHMDRGVHILHLKLWSDEWCHIYSEHWTDVEPVVASHLLENVPNLDLFQCRWEPEQGEYSYNYYVDGDLLEEFSVHGDGFETLVFKSELRRVPVRKMLKASEFMTESLITHGLLLKEYQQRVSSEAKVTVCLPAKKKKSWLKSLLGAAWLED